jgi:mannose-6-phosphate isomerase-like protein (cupin superfamily)
MSEPETGADPDPTSDTAAPGGAGSPADRTPQQADQVRPVDLRDYVEFSTERAQRVRVHATEHLALDLWCLEPRQATPALHLRQDVTYTIIGGRSWFVTEEGEVGLDPMGSMLVPAGVAHGFENRSADPLIVVASQAPPGTDVAEAPVSEEAAAVVPEPPPGLLRRVTESLLGPRRRD